MTSRLGTGKIANLFLQCRHQRTGIGQARVWTAKWQVRLCAKKNRSQVFYVPGSSATDGDGEVNHIFMHSQWGVKSIQKNINKETSVLLTTRERAWVTLEYWSCSPCRTLSFLSKIIGLIYPQTFYTALKHGKSPVGTRGLAAWENHRVSFAVGVRIRNLDSGFHGKFKFKQKCAKLPVPLTSACSTCQREKV